MKFIYMRDHGGDIETFESNDIQEAIDYGQRDWNHLTDRERNKCGFAYVIESVNPDELADQHFDGDYIKKFK